MTPDKLKSLRAIRDGGHVARHEIDWLVKQGMIDDHKRLTQKGAECLADYEPEENTGD